MEPFNNVTQSPELTVSWLVSTFAPALDRNSSTAAMPRSIVFDAFLKSVCLLILAIGAIGNLVVVVTFGIRWGRLKTCEILMINLALADLVGTACLPLITFFELQKISMAPLKDVGCQWLYAFNLSSLTVSALTLVCIAADRYVVVTCPFRRKPHKGKIVLVSLVTWLLSFGLGAVYLFNGVVVDRNFCRGNMSVRTTRIHTVVVFVFQVAFPMVVMAVLYALTLRALQATRSKALALNNRMMEIRHKQNRRTTRLFLTVVATFYCLIVPHSIFMMVYNFTTGIPHTTAFYLYYSTLMMHMVNSSVNPLIYARMHHSFRAAALKVLCCRSGSFSNTAWQSLIKSRKRLSSSGWTKTTTVNSRETATSELHQPLSVSTKRRSCPSPVTESFTLHGTPRSQNRRLPKDTNANLMLLVNESDGSNNSRLSPLLPSQLRQGSPRDRRSCISDQRPSSLCKYNLLSTADKVNDADLVVIEDILTCL